jgi:hypothetical protein
MTAAVFAAFFLVAPATAGAQGPEAALFRVFLKNGRTLVSYGEWARAGDGVVFSMPTKLPVSASSLQLVTVSSFEVDWDRTEAYAHALRASTYAATRGEADFARATGEVAAALNQVALLADPAARLGIAQAARRQLADWTGEHYGYRANDVREILAMLDEVIAELGAESGQTRFGFSMVAPPAASPDVALLPPPNAAEVVEQMMTATAVVDTPTERITLLQSVLKLVETAAGLLPRAWADTVRKVARRKLADEERAQREYASLQASTIHTAGRAADKGDVRELERLRGKVENKHKDLGASRPAEMAALRALVDERLEATKARRLAMDQYALRAPGLRKYGRQVDPSVRRLVRVTPSLEDVRAMAGPSPSVLKPLIDRLRKDGYWLATIAPPRELGPVHALLQSAAAMALQAFSLRLDAADDNNLDQAQRASSAAAGALLLLDRARADLASAIGPPTFQ